MENSNLSIEGRARLDILNAALKVGSKGAHIAPSLSDVDICLAVLQVSDIEKDSFILSKGHGALGYYAAMHCLGIITDEQFDSFEKNGGCFPGQPSKGVDNHIEYSSGSLGMGLPYALGVAISKKKTTGMVYVIVGDGELNEGSNWESAALASQYKLDNLCVIVDRNSLQSDGKCDDIAGQDLEALWKANGWMTIECDGHSVTEIQKSITSEHIDKPLVIMARTIKGKGVSFMENNNAWHHAVLKKDDYELAISEIGDTYGLH